MVERWFETPSVVGSNPTFWTNYARVAQLRERLLVCKSHGLQSHNDISDSLDVKRLQRTRGHM